MAQTPPNDAGKRLSAVIETAGDISTSNMKRLKMDDSLGDVSLGLKMDDSHGDMFKLVGSNYTIWKSRMEDLLYCKDLYLPLHGNEAKPEDMSLMNWNIMHRKTCAYIRSFIDQSLYHNFLNEHKADVLWKKIETIFEIKTAYNKASIFRNIFQLRYQDNTSMEEHLNTFQCLMNQTITMGIALADEIMALMLLGSLPESWDILVMTLGNSTPDGKMSLEMVKTSLLIEETRRKEREALVHDFVIYSTDPSVGSTYKKTDWIIFTRAPYHVTPYRDLFITYSSGSFGRAMDNEGVRDVVGMGNILLRTNMGCSLILKDVIHAPGIRLNMISVSKLCREGYAQEFSDGKWTLTRDTLTIGEGKMLNSLFCMQDESSTSEVNAASGNSSIELWHKRLGHMSQQDLYILSRMKLIPEMTGMSLQTCVDCSIDKQERVSSQNLSLGRRSNRLDLVHTDLCYMKDRSVGGKLYFVTFIDDFSRKIWCFPLKSKDQLFEAFKEFQAKVTGKKLKCICVGNDSEYEGRFEQSCRDQGIKLEKSVVNNGVAESMIKIICERIKSMLSHSKLPNSFWGEAMSSVVYLMNLSPSVALGGLIPERVWTGGKDVSYKHLRVFGCRAVVDRIKLCIFLGYGNEECVYRLFDPVDEKVVISKEVTFYEDESSR